VPRLSCLHHTRSHELAGQKLAKSTVEAMLTSFSKAFLISCISVVLGSVLFHMLSLSSLWFWEWVCSFRAWFLSAIAMHLSRSSRFLACRSETSSISTAQVVHDQLHVPHTCLSFRSLVAFPSQSPSRKASDYHSIAYPWRYGLASDCVCDFTRFLLIVSCFAPSLFTAAFALLLLSIRSLVAFPSQSPSRKASD
jgi:hypothetical protein